MNRETGVAVIMVTHDDRLARAADRILLIEDGRMRELDPREHEVAGIGPPT
jgi:ABC-type lipoprotein export system ATPase subunit